MLCGPLFCKLCSIAEVTISAMNPLFPTPQKSEDLISIGSPGMRDFRVYSLGKRQFDRVCQIKYRSGHFIHITPYLHCESPLFPPSFFVVK